MDQVSIILANAGTNLRPDSVADILVYATFIGSILVLALLPDGNDRAQYLLFATMLFCVVDLLITQSILINEGESTNALFAFIVHVGIFVFPAITVGSIRKGKKKPGPAIMMCLVTSLAGGLYLLMTFGLLVSEAAVRPLFLTSF
ncbi:MAG: hypothetical protein Q9P44_17445 [Anaerolineae bacterium]|nr:hypothetical protein [Anaerolineae bacterium]